MTNYIIKNAFNLKSANNKLLQPGDYFKTETDEQEAEMQTFLPDGSASPVPTHPAPVVDPMADEVDTPLDPTDDMSVVPGVGQKTEKKLNDAGITTLSNLKAAMLDASKTDAMKELLGTAYDKILAYFQTV